MRSIVYSPIDSLTKEMLIADWYPSYIVGEVLSNRIQLCNVSLESHP